MIVRTPVMDQKYGEYNIKKKLKSVSYTIDNPYITESNSFAKLPIAG